MRKVTQKIHAKINLTLDVLGEKDGFHNIESVVSSIELYDVITVKKRTDKIITLTEKGLDCECPMANNNAYITAKAFMEKYETPGVDITLTKNIPVGGGLGGSSADIAGVLLAMKKLFGIADEDGLKEIASRLGSDSCFMLKGGSAVISGRGDKISNIQISEPIYLILITNKKSISAKLCYKQFDEAHKSYPCVTWQAVEYLTEGELEKYVEIANNHLTESAIKFVPEMSNALDYLKKSGARTALVSGSGSTVYGVYFTKREQARGYEYLLDVYDKNRLILCETRADQEK